MLLELWQWLLDPMQWQGPDAIPARTTEHLYYVGVAMGWALLIGLPIGIGLGHLGRGGWLAINLSNVGRAIPEFGIIILVFMIAGFGDLPILIALVALALPPLITNSYVGMRQVDADLVEAARAMGLRRHQQLLRVELPLALPLVMAGLRTAAVQVMATATLAAFVGLGGLGRYLIDGLAVRNLVEVVGGALIVAALALILEGLLALLQRVLVSPGLQRTAMDARP
jgi:osmoprotectant transport system permease protein